MASSLSSVDLLFSFTWSLYCSAARRLSDSLARSAATVDEAEEEVELLLLLLASLSLAKLVYKNTCDLMINQIIDYFVKEEEKKTGHTLCKSDLATCLLRMSSDSKRLLHSKHANLSVSM